MHTSSKSTFTSSFSETSTTTGVSTTTKTKASSEMKTLQRSSRGAISIKSVHRKGANMVIENTTSGAEARSQSLKGWRLQKTVDGSVATDIPLKDFELGSNAIFTVWAKGAKDMATATADNEQVADEVSFGIGSFTWTIVDEAGNKKAKLFAKFSGEVPE